MSSTIEKLGSEITWEILGCEDRWYVWASHNGCENEDDDFKFSDSGDSLAEAIEKVARRVVYEGPSWVMAPVPRRLNQ